MTNYEYFMNRSEECLERAKKVRNIDMKKFFLNAGEGFKIKALNLSIKEAEKENKSKLLIEMLWLTGSFQ